jgi:hypothetical protein
MAREAPARDPPGSAMTLAQSTGAVHTPRMDLTLFTVAALVIYAWRAIRRTRGDWSGPIADVAEAPPDAEPIGRPRLNDDGLATFRLDLSAGSTAPVPPRRPSGRVP